MEAFQKTKMCYCNNKSMENVSKKINELICMLEKSDEEEMSPVLKQSREHAQLNLRALALNPGHREKEFKKNKCYDSEESKERVCKEMKDFIVILEKRGTKVSRAEQIKRKHNPILKYPGYVNIRHPALNPGHRDEDERLHSAENPCSNENETDASQAVRKTASQELRGGVLYIGCSCTKRNGLQDDCQRRECGGRPKCISLNPGPCCDPSSSPKPTR
uniref:Uncharacterized protein n=1 Tax=Clastoptera arizonana TaxID=38151 RepID=A0A1B6DNX7_9HEMI